MRKVLVVVVLALCGCAHLFVEPSDPLAAKVGKVAVRTVLGVGTLGVSEATYFWCGKYGCVPRGGVDAAAALYLLEQRRSVVVPRVPVQCQAGTVDSGWYASTTVQCY